MDSIEELENSISPEELELEKENKRLCKRIAEELKFQGKSKKDFAVLMNVDPALVSRWLGGVHFMGFDTLKKIEKILNVEIFNRSFTEPRRMSQEQFEQTYFIYDDTAIKKEWLKHERNIKEVGRIKILLGIGKARPIVNAKRSSGLFQQKNI